MKGTCTKRCVGIVCCGCLLCTAVVLGVMIPVGIFVILPSVAQHQLDASSLALLNSTLLPCDDFTHLPYEAQVINVAEMDSKAPVDVVFHEYEATFTVWTCDGKDGFHCANPNATKLGVSKMPKMRLHNGKNSILTTSTLSITCDEVLLITDVIMPLFSRQPVKMSLSAESLTASVLGLEVHKLKFSKYLNCTYIGQPPNPVPSSKYCSNLTAPGQPVFSAVSMSCAPPGSSAAVQV